MGSVIMLLLGEDVIILATCCLVDVEDLLGIISTGNMKFFLFVETIIVF
jgi:hypothetical protein